MTILLLGVNASYERGDRSEVDHGSEGVGQIM
jgi:hypothetical protein